MEDSVKRLFKNQDDLSEDWERLRDMIRDKHALEQRIEYFTGRNNYVRIDQEQMYIRRDNVLEMIRKTLEEMRIPESMYASLMI